jgi:hypothetical protein
MSKSVNVYNGVSDIKESRYLVNSTETEYIDEPIGVEVNGL